MPRVKLHMAAKPVALMEQLLTPMAGPILDPFMGSGTIGEACATPGHPNAGVDPGSFDGACWRLEGVSA